LLVGDHTAWGRPQARTLNDRTFEHQPTPIKGQKPITIGRIFPQKTGFEATGKPRLMRA
jgi:hypothetical protein